MFQQICSLIKIRIQQSPTLVIFFATYLILMFSLDKGELFSRVEWQIYDSWVRQNHAPLDSDLVVVGVDSNSLSQYGRWPWSRADQAKIIENIASSGARVIVVGILYIDADTRNPADDRRLADVIEAADNVILPFYNGEGTSGPVLPIPQLQIAARDVGHMFLSPDTDGITRRVYLKAGYRNPHWSQISLAALETIGVSTSQLPGITYDLSGTRGFSWVVDHEVLIPFQGVSNNTFRTVSAVDVLQGRYTKSVFQDAVVFFGLTAPGLDTVPTPILNHLSSVEVAATVYSALRDGRTTNQSASIISYLITALSIGTLLLIYTRWSLRWGFAWTLIFAVLPIGLSFLFYRVGNTWFPPLLASSTILMAFPGWTWLRLGFLKHQEKETTEI